MNQLIKSLGKWTTTIHSSQRIRPFYYSSTTNILYRGYRDDWHENTKYQFDEYEYNDDNVFDFVLIVRNVELKYIPNDTIPVDTASARQGWKVCLFQTLKPQPIAPASPTDLVKFVKSQPAYISQYYTNIKREIPEAEVYKVLKYTKKILIATEGGAKVFKGSLGFVITDAKHRVLISCYGHTAGHDSLSFRTKASAFLAALRVVLLIAEYYKEEPTGLLATNKEITLFTDSLSMMNKLDAMNKYPTAHLNCAIDPEWDLLQVIHRLLACVIGPLA